MAQEPTAKCEPNYDSPKGSSWPSYINGLKRLAATGAPSQNSAVEDDPTAGVRIALVNAQAELAMSCEDKT